MSLPFAETVTSAVTLLLPNAGEMCSLHSSTQGCVLKRGTAWHGAVQRCNLALRRALKHYRDALEPMVP